MWEAWDRNTYIGARSQNSGTPKILFAPIMVRCPDWSSAACSPLQSVCCWPTPHWGVCVGGGWISLSGRGLHLAAIPMGCCCPWLTGRTGLKKYLEPGYGKYFRARRVWDNVFDRSCYCSSNEICPIKGDLYLMFSGLHEVCGSNEASLLLVRKE